MAKQNVTAYRRVINFWALYHWADNAFSTTVISAILPVYYSKVAASTLSANTATAYFGFYGMSSRVGGFLGPLVFAVVSQLTGNSRFSIISIVIFFIVGAVFLTRVDVNKGMRIAREEDEGIGTV
jgi:MFS-type transporter involved in bile tolerance (Atg22 family)